MKENVWNTHLIFVVLGVIEFVDWIFLVLHSTSALLSVCDLAKIENWMKKKKSQNMLVWLNKLILAPHFSKPKNTYSSFIELLIEFFLCYILRVLFFLSVCDLAKMKIGWRKKKKSKHAGLAQQNGFGPAFFF